MQSYRANYYTCVCWLPHIFGPAKIEDFSLFLIRVVMMICGVQNIRYSAVVNFRRIFVNWVQPVFSSTVCSAFKVSTLTLLFPPSRYVTIVRRAKYWKTIPRCYLLGERCLERKKCVHQEHGPLRRISTVTMRTLKRFHFSLNFHPNNGKRTLLRSG